MLWPLSQSYSFKTILTDYFSICLCVKISSFPHVQAKPRTLRSSPSLIGLTQPSKITRYLWRHACGLSENSAHIQKVKVVLLRLVLRVTRVWCLLLLLGRLGNLLMLAEDVHARDAPLVGLTTDRDRDVCHFSFYQLLFQHLSWMSL